MVPDLDSLLASAHVVSIPMRTPFRGVTTREAMLLRGPTGWGEWSPFPEYAPVEAARWLRAAIEAGWSGFPAPVRDSVPVNATVPAVAADRVREILGRYDGFEAVKVKVAERGQGLADDVARVAAVRERVGPGLAVRVDANGGWAVDDAPAAITALARYDLEYVEQPVMSIADMARVRRSLAAAGVDVRIAADESIRKVEDPMRVVEAEAADLMVVKVAPLGGVASALRVAEEVGLPAVVSSAIDTSVGLRAGVALAAALPELPFACGLGTATLLAGDVSSSPLLPEAGALPVREVEAEPELLERWAAPPEREAWWRRRLAAAHPHAGPK